MGARLVCPRSAMARRRKSSDGREKEAWFKKRRKEVTRGR
jgi:hypothetical protein